MASKKAKRYLASIGQPIARKIHTRTELDNFSAGTGAGRFPMPFHVIRMDDRTGDSKRTVGWHATLESARADVRAMVLADDGADRARGGAEHMRARRFCYYIRDIRNGNIYRA